VSALAAAQRGVVSHRQLLDAGATARQVERWVQAHRLRGIHEGVYAVGHLALAPGGHFMAAVLAGGEGAALSHLSAAAHLGLRRSAASRVDVMVPRSGERDRGGIRFHRPKIYGPQDVCVWEGIPCTTVARTLVDCAAVLRFEPLELTVETAERLDLLDVRAIADVLARIARPRGVRNLRRCLGPERLDASLAASNLERRFLRLCRDAGLPRPEINHRIEVAPGVWHKVDFAWPELRIAIEIDSWEFHRTRIAARRDRRRDRELRDAGWRVDRFTEDDVEDDPKAIVAFLRHHLTSRDD
jgi:hypothetical protein